MFCLTIADDTAELDVIFFGKVNTRLGRKTGRFPALTPFFPTQDAEFFLGTSVEVFAADEEVREEVQWLTHTHHLTPPRGLLIPCTPRCARGCGGACR